MESKTQTQLSHTPFPCVALHHSPVGKTPNCSQHHQRGHLSHHTPVRRPHPANTCNHTPVGLGFVPPCSPSLQRMQRLRPSSILRCLSAACLCYASRSESAECSEPAGFCCQWAVACGPACKITVVPGARPAAAVGLAVARRIQGVANRCAECRLGTVFSLTGTSMERSNVHV